MSHREICTPMFTIAKNVEAIQMSMNRRLDT